METSPTTRRRRRELPPPWRLGIDTREQDGFQFNVEAVNPVLPFTTELITLKTGDYTAIDYADEITVERKSLADAYGSFGNDHDRFEREIQRMAAFKYAAVVIEAELSEICLSPPPFSQRMNPKSIVASMLAWSQRYGVHFFCCPGKAFAEKLTFRILERWVRDKQRSF